MGDKSRTGNKILANLFWRYAERCGAQLVQFIVSIVLARLIAPEAFGTIAIVLVFTNLLQVFVDSGIGNALIQKNDTDELDFSTVFYFNILWCLLLYLVLYLAASPIASFYKDNSLIPVNIWFKKCATGVCFKNLAIQEVFFCYIRWYISFCYCWNCFSNTRLWCLGTSGSETCKYID